MEELISVLDPGLHVKTLAHPCFSGGCQNARMHLPVAPACNIACNYCSRKFDCVNESRPGVTSEILSPEQALAKFRKVRESVKNLKVIGIAGPGDALANFDAVSRTFELIREEDPDITFCLSTNGLYLPDFADELAFLGVTHVTVTINTVDPEIGAKIYRKVTYAGRDYSGTEGASLLLEKQLAGLARLAKLGIVAKVNTVMIKGVNDGAIVDLSKALSERNVFIGNVMQLIPAPGSAFERMPLTTRKELDDLRAECGKYLRQMYHCQQCRADAIGMLAEDRSAEFREAGCAVRAAGTTSVAGTTNEADTVAERKARLFAVTTRDGRLVNQHFGHADSFSIYRAEAGRVDYLEKRDARKVCGGPDSCGDAGEIVEEIAALLVDCDAIVTQRIGPSPQRTLEAKGKTVIQTYGLIEEEVLKADLRITEGAL